MNLIKTMDIGSTLLYSDSYFSDNYNQILYLKKVPYDTTNRDKFYLNIYANINGNMVQQGFLYFYMDFDNNASTFIGLGVKEEFRNLNIGSLLIASWIELSLNNNIYYLDANKKQKKPFILYLLKTYGFEIFDKSLYDTRNDVITICKSIYSFDKRKFLMFKDSIHEKLFMNTNIYTTDDYKIIHDLVDSYELDKVILPIQNRNRSLVKYNMLNRNWAEQKTKLVLSKHKK